MEGSRAAARLWELESRWTMGRVMPRDLLAAIEVYLRREHPERCDDLLGALRGRAEELREADADLPVDGQSEGMLALTATVLAAYETLLPVLDGDAGRTVAYLRHALGGVLRRPLEVAFGALGRRDDALGAIEAACREEAPLYGDYFDIRYDRTSPDAFEMRVERCFFLDFFARHGLPGVTTVLCAWDANWMRAVDPAASGLRAERTSLKSLGDDACRFRVVRTGDPTSGYSDVLPGDTG
ncbi:L-2-amino-thiazoline-4-carboxylic acid hydrolase [Actinomycetospora sp. C-140]